MDTDKPFLLRPAEAAVALGISRSKAYELIASGEIPSVEIGGVKRVPSKQLLAMIDSRVHESTGR